MANQTATPPVDPAEQEQPYDVDEMPIPGGSLEADMLFRFEMGSIDSVETNSEERGADKNMEAVEAGCHVECRAKDLARDLEALWVIDRVDILISLETSEDGTKPHRQPKR